MSGDPTGATVAAEPTYSWGVVLLVVTVCVVASAFFSGSETGLMSVSRIRLRRVAGDRRGGRRRLVELMLGRPDDSIMTCLIGNNLANVLAAAVATAALAERLGAGSQWLAAAIVTLLLVVGGEILPKVVYREYPERLMLASAPLLRGVMIALLPVRWLLTRYARLWHAVLPGEGPGGRVGLSREGMIALLLSHDLPAGQDRRFAEELDRFLALGQVRLQQIMIPRAAVVTLPASATVAECALVARRSGHSRLPVVEADGRVIGWILARDLLFTHVLPTAALPPGLLRSNLLADADLTPYELLEEMQWRRQQMAIVVDRGGESLGLVTLENLVEAVVGRIEDEFDRPAAAPAAEGRRSPAAHGAG